MADEKIIQIQESEGVLSALTNQGRLFKQITSSGSVWREIELPDLKKPKQRAQAKQEGYSEPFEKFWKEYPKDHGGNKGKAYKQWAKRILEGGIPNASSIVWQMVNGMRNYTKFVEATGQTLKHPATFIGPDRFYLDDFTIPDSAKQKNKLKLPYDDNALDAFAVDHKLSRPRTGELGREYRARIQPDLDKLSANLA